jgi:hypothetical protein
VRKQTPKFLFYFKLFFIFKKNLIKIFSPPMCEILCILELGIGRRIQWCKKIEFLGVPRFAQNLSLIFLELIIKNLAIQKRKEN